MVFIGQLTRLRYKLQSGVRVVAVCRSDWLGFVGPMWVGHQAPKPARRFTSSLLSVVR